MSKLVVLLGAILVFLVAAADAQGPANAVARFYAAEILHSSLGNFRDATESWREQIQLLDSSRKPIGASYTSCIRIDMNVRNCSSTYALPQGTMVALGVIGNQNRYSLILVGGTGAYLNYQGWVSVFDIGTNQQRVGPNGQLVPLRFSILTFHLHRLGR